MNGSTQLTLRKRLIVAAGLAACAVLLAVPAAAEEFNYVGSANCKMCHNKDASGKQFTIWENSAHAKAYATLASEESKKIAQGMGIADPQKADACLRCHVTAHGVAAERIGPRFKIEEGVGCESCHGPGSGYNKLNVKKQVMTSEITGASIGLWEINEALCVACHNEESPTFKGFNYAEAIKAIAHPYPAGYVEATYKK